MQEPTITSNRNSTSAMYGKPTDFSIFYIQFKELQGPSNQISKISRTTTISQLFPRLEK